MKAIPFILILPAAFALAATGFAQEQGNQGQGEVKKATKETEEAGRKANATVVGPQTQQQNEAAARNPQNATDATKKRNEQEAHRTANDVGRTTTTAADVIGTAVADTTTATDKPGRYEPFALEWNRSASSLAAA